MKAKTKMVWDIFGDPLKTVFITVVIVVSFFLGVIFHKHGMEIIKGFIPKSEAAVTVVSTMSYDPPPGFITMAGAPTLNGVL